MKQVSIRGTTYNVAKNEFIRSDQYTPIVVYDKLSEFDREIFLLKSISKLNEDFEFINYGDSHDNYVFKNVEKWFDSSYKSTTLSHSQNFSNKKMIARVDPQIETSINCNPIMLLCDDTGNINEYNKYKIDNGRSLYVHKMHDNYALYLRIHDGVVMLDNLIHITFMIKNSGDVIRYVLTENLKIADQITVLDTGSTDNTLDIVNEIAIQEPNRIKVYEEPFIDFSTSRNRLMDLAEEKNRKCAFHIMLDDTYVLRNANLLREFLHEIRSDEFESFSINIKGIDVIYSSNRIIRPESKLRYQYKIHETINSNAKESALIPIYKGYIEDLQSEYMVKRTADRKENDLKLLFEELDENPKDPRIYYYIAETYLCMEDYTNAHEYYSKRLKMGGYSEETYDAMYKKAVMEHIHLNKEWADVQEGYLECYKFDPTRPESMFMIGYEYHNKNIPLLAHMFFKKAFEIGIPVNQNMNIKVEQSGFTLPNFLINTSYLYGEHNLGIQCCLRILEYTNNKDTVATYWLNVFTMLEKANNVKVENQKHPVNKKKILFVSDGGWDNWDGETLYKNGIGGSETFTIKYAEWLQKNDKYNVVVCCKCKETKVYNDVTYIKIEDCIEYVKSNFVTYAIVNRYSSYIFLLQHLGIKNIYFVAHDIAIPGDIIPVLPSLKGVLCISEWAKEQFCSTHQSIPRSLFSVISYGIDVDKFPRHSIRKYSFIYSSFANRGLLELLKMFPRIVQKYPSAVLNVFCDLDNTWLVEHYPSELQQIKILLEQHKDFVINYGWVNQRVLNNFWSTSHVWLYPCTFAETCCLTAYEAAASRTLAISNDLGALKENVNVLVEGNPEEETWKDRALDRLFEILDDEDLYKNLITQNYTWVLKEKNFPRVVGDFTGDFLSEKLNSNF